MLSSCDLALVFKAVSDETRLRIVDMLRGDELCACDILEEFEITQPTLSYHMKILTECGLVKARKDGPWTRYTLNLDLVQQVKAFLDHVASADPEPVYPVRVGIELAKSQDRCCGEK